jgi:RimJ/RimL family protein N-acetyltransferase
MYNQDQFITFRSQAGHLIRVRPLRSGDAPQLVAIFNHMSSQSRFQRFHQTVGHVSVARIKEEAASIAQGDPERNWGLIAFAEVPDHAIIPVGAARLVRTGPNEAEVAISLRDDFQNVGIGTQLMRMLAAGAKEMGIRRLVADIQNDNSAIWCVFKKLPFPVTRVPQGPYSSVIIDLTGGHPASPPQE